MAIKWRRAYDERIDRVPLLTTHRSLWQVLDERYWRHCEKCHQWFRRSGWVKITDRPGYGHDSEMADHRYRCAVCGPGLDEESLEIPDEERRA